MIMIQKVKHNKLCLTHFFNKSFLKNHKWGHIIIISVLLVLKHIFETALHLAHTLRSTNCPATSFVNIKVWKVVSFGLCHYRRSIVSFSGSSSSGGRGRAWQAFVIAGVVFFFAIAFCHTHGFLNLYIASLVPIILSQVWWKKTCRHDIYAMLQHKYCSQSSSFWTRQ
jgi:hypothetical protein